MTWCALKPWIEQTLDEAPTEHGVYAFYDNGSVIYYGKAEQEGGIRARLRQHWNDEKNECLVKAFAGGKVAVSWERHKAPVNREKELIEAHVTVYKRLPRCNQRIG
jgi:excinuclease UvrABC nuclease subunit